MQVQVHTDNHVKGGSELFGFVETEVRGTLSRFGEQITRVEVHLNDLNGHKTGPHEKRCLMEARIAGHQPVAVHHEADTLDAAVSGAVDKLEKSLDHLFGKLGHRKGRTPYGGEPEV
ncbi:MAG: HPF/RaiA family ribosome-associated protein [Isosphaeraceae bacterium]